MKRINWIALWIALATAPLVLAIQLMLRPVTPAASSAWLLLGPLPSLVIGICFPYSIVVRPPRTATAAARAFTLMALATLGIQIAVEVTGLIPGADTFDILDIVASVAGMFLGALLYRRVAPHLGYDPRAE